MKITRLAVPALVAFSLAACSSSDSSTNSGSSSVVRLQQFQKFNAAASRAGAAGAGGAAYGFSVAGLGQLFGSSTATVTVNSNGVASLDIAGRTTTLGRVPQLAVAGSYSAMAISATDIEHYSTSTDTTNTNMIVAWRDTTAVIIGGSDLTSDSFGSGSGEGYIFESPSSEWYATAGSFSLSGMSTGRACSIDASIQQALESAYGGSGVSNLSWTCNTATFNATLNITGSAPSAFGNGTNNATGSRTASITANGLPGIRVISNATYTGTAAARAGFLRHAR